MRLNIHIWKVGGSQKGIYTLEYVAFIALIIFSLLAMRFYVRNAVSGYFRSASDSFGQGRQYEPGVTSESRH